MCIPNLFEMLILFFIARYKNFIFPDGQYSSNPSLSRNLEDDFRGLAKPYSVSEPPIPVTTSKMMIRSSDKALDALTATYQTLSITAQALGNNNNLKLKLSTPVNGTDVSAVPGSECQLNGHGNDSEETTCVQGSNTGGTNSKSCSENKNNDAGSSVVVSTTEVTEHSKSTPEKSTELSTKENVGNKEDETIHREGDKDKLCLPLMNNKIGNDNKSRISAGDPAKSPLLSPGVSYSTVDEFFRALMDSVPKNALDSAEKVAAEGVSGRSK